jgi:uncharacterized coiled-coil protein SlyX
LGDTYNLVINYALVGTTVSDLAAPLPELITGLPSRVNALENAVAEHQTYIENLSTIQDSVSASLTTIESSVSSLNDAIETQGGRLDTLDSEFSSTSTHLTEIDGILTSHGTALATLSTSLGDKADESEVTALAGRVATLEGGSTGDITALDGRVTTLESTATSQGSVISSLNTSVSSLSTSLSGKANTSDIGTVNSPLSVIESNSGQSFELKSRVTTSLTTFPVPLLRPKTANKVIAFDLMPNGTPSDYGSNGVAWIDTCNADVHNNENPVVVNRLGIGLTKATIGVTTFNGGTVLPLEMIVGSKTPITLETTGNISLANKLYPSLPNEGKQTSVSITAGVGLPNNSYGSSGDFYFRSDGFGSSSVYQKRGGVWVPFSDTTVFWQNLQNSSLSSGYIVNNNTLSSGANSGVAIDATSPFSYVIDLEDTNQEGVVVYLEDTATNNFAWSSGNSLISHTYFYGGIIQVGVTAGNAGTSVYSVPALPIKLKITKSGNDLIYSTSTDGGATYTARYTHTGRLSGKTTIYLKTLFAIAGATKKIKVSQS